MLFDSRPIPVVLPKDPIRKAIQEPPDIGPVESAKESVVVTNETTQEEIIPTAIQDIPETNISQIISDNQEIVPTSDSKNEEQEETFTSEGQEKNITSKIQEVIQDKNDASPAQGKPVEQDRDIISDVQVEDLSDPKDYVDTSCSNDYVKSDKITENSKSSHEEPMELSNKNVITINLVEANVETDTNPVSPPIDQEVNMILKSITTLPPAEREVRSSVRDGDLNQPLEIYPDRSSVVDMTTTANSQRKRKRIITV